tara:strand:- start:167 stop:361 length:195 start_codon:yes stop_codon:yes gene_type:complete
MRVLAVPRSIDRSLENIPLNPFNIGVTPQKDHMIWLPIDKITGLSTNLCKINSEETQRYSKNLS